MWIPWVHVWKGAILLTKAGRYVVPAVIAAGAATIGFFSGRASNKNPKDKSEDEAKSK